MKELLTPIAEFCKPRGRQTYLAEKLGISQAAISQMIASGRKIDVVQRRDEVIELREQRTLAKGCRPARA